MSTGKTAIQSQSDYLTYLYSSPRNLVVGNLSLNPLTSSTLNITNYFPGTDYAICGFFQSSDPNKTLTTQLNCTVVKTLTNEADEIYTATAIFTSKPTYNDRQTILCYLQGQLNNPTSTAFISNSYGERCLPMAALYKYNGTQNSELFDIYYLVTNDTSSATTAAKANFTGLFTAGGLGLTSTSISTVNGKLPSGSILDSFTLTSTTPTAYSTIIGDSTLATPTGTTMTDPNTIPIQFPASAFVGSVYMGIYVTNSSNSAPSPENVTNCKLGSGSVSLQYCQRIMLNNNQNPQTVSIVVDGVNSSSTYKVYLTPANRFPYRPYLFSSVTSLSFPSTATGSITFANSSNFLVQAGKSVTSTVVISTAAAVDVTATLPTADWAITSASTSAPNANTKTITFALAGQTNVTFAILAPSSAKGSYLIPVVSGNSLYYVTKGYLNVTVTQPVTVSPTDLTASAGGCSQMLTAILPFLPNTTATLLVRYATNGSSYPTSPSPITFTNTDLTKTFMLCPTSTTTAGSIVLTVEANSSDGLYAVATSNRPSITLSVTATPNGTVTLSTANFSIQKGGCSPTATLTVNTLPDSDLIVTFDKAALDANRLYMVVSPLSYTN